MFIFLTDRNDSSYPSGPHYLFQLDIETHSFIHDMKNNETGEQVGGEGEEGITQSYGDGDSGVGGEVDGDENTIQEGDEDEDEIVEEDEDDGGGREEEDQKEEGPPQ